MLLNKQQTETETKLSDTELDALLLIVLIVELGNDMIKIRDRDQFQNDYGNHYKSLCPTGRKCFLQ